MDEKVIRLMREAIEAVVSHHVQHTDFCRRHNQDYPRECICGRHKCELAYEAILKADRSAVQPSDQP